MTAGAWRALRANWQLPWTSRLLLQSFVAGPLFSVLSASQARLTASRRRAARLTAPLFVLGYWRSGTTLLHDYLCRDERFGYPSTYACMQPHHFILTQEAVLPGARQVLRRPMDAMQISASSPQEDEFALLALGARSPYEDLLAPAHFAAALALADPRELAPREQEQWRRTFREFLRGLSVVERGRPLILKSPPHGYRVATLRELFPDARFVLIVRSPERVFESATRMWLALFAMYALEGIPPEEQVRSVILRDRLRFEAKLTAGLDGLPKEQVALVRYEELVQDPRQTLGRVYAQLQLGEFERVAPAIEAEQRARSSYVARNALPPEPWINRLQASWASIFETYGYTPQHTTTG